MIRIGVDVHLSRIPKEVLEWNAEIDRRKEQKRRDAAAAKYLQSIAKG